MVEEDTEEVADVRADVFPRGLISMETDSRSVVLPDDSVRLCLAFFASLAASIMAETEKDLLLLFLTVFTSKSFDTIGFLVSILCGKDGCFFGVIGF